MTTPLDSVNFGAETDGSSEKAMNYREGSGQKLVNAKKKQNY